MTENITITVDEATNISVAAFVACGMSADTAADSAWPLVEGEMMGITTHGLNRVPIYANRLRLGGIDPLATIDIDRRSPAIALLDGGNAAGTRVASMALETAMQMVATSGIAYAGCRHSNHCGALAPYALKACRAGYLLLAGTSASTSMAPWGGGEARLGNNPLCFAAPIGEGPHFLLDMAMSVVARAKIRAARAAGETIPSEWAVDRQGRPTTDPAAALDGFLSPMGGYKGSGLSQAIDILSGVLNGAKFLSGIPSWMEHPETPSELGHFFVLIDPERLIGAEQFRQSMQEFSRILLETPAADPSQPVRLPGKLEQQKREQAMVNGLRLPVALVDEIRALAAARAIDAG